MTGSPRVGSTLTAGTGTWTPSDGLSHTYQWFAAGVPVDGATGATYLPVSDDVGKTITVAVTASRDGYRSATRTSAPTAAVTLPPLAAAALPTIEGTPRVGDPLTATPGSWNPADGVTYAYQWSVGGLDVDGATLDTYTPAAADAGKTVRVEVTASRDGFAPASATSLPTAAVAGPPLVNTTAPRVTGTAQVGKRLTAEPGTWTPGTPTLGYQWLLNGAPVAGQTSSTFTVPAAALGKLVAVQVTASGPGQTPVPVTSAPTAKVKAGVLRVVRKPVVTGTAKVGKVLRATAGSVSPAATRATFQWLRNGKAIRRATKASYKLVAADRRKRISVVVSYVRVGYTTVKATSKATAAVR